MTGSVLVHMAALILLTPWDRRGLPGMAGPDQGAGVDVTLVSAATLGLAAPRAPPMDALVTEPAPLPPIAAQAPSDASLADNGASFAPADQPKQPKSRTEPRAVAWASTGESNVAAPLDGSRRGAAETAGGDPRLTEDILVQIARCLPGQLRPRLMAQRLVLKLDAGGALAAAPQIDSGLPLLTAEDRTEADRVVQAALQCGPYRQASAAARTVSLAVDFTGIRSAPLSPR